MDSLNRDSRSERDFLSDLDPDWHLDRDADHYLTMEDECRAREAPGSSIDGGNNDWFE
ncbi:hypothetical protein [Ciceribacter sp. RN22]|uniref:hypothetical protein n=1 Tax=Ciceribacter sp. RN22 TaxID=2954932 RepID=UPI0020920067|nr:hypothetical protein [Ciceribacter sp. RN22]MCO6178828.1 hypothetical protein [Ciceribacter sp. RN22]